MRNHFRHPTRGRNEFWQTDFTYDPKLSTNAIAKRPRKVREATVAFTTRCFLDTGKVQRASDRCGVSGRSEK